MTWELIPPPLTATHRFYISFQTPFQNFVIYLRRLIPPREIDSTLDGISQHKLNADVAIQVMIKHLDPRSSNSKHHEQQTVLRLGYFITVLALILLGNAQFATDHGTDVFPDLYEASIQELQHGMDAGHFTSVDLVEVGKTDRATVWPFIVDDGSPGVFRQNKRSQFPRTLLTCSPRTQPFCTFPSLHSRPGT